MKIRFLSLLIAILIIGCESKPKEDWTTPLHEALRSANRLLVRSGGTCHRQPDQEIILLDLRDAGQVNEIIQAIQIDPEKSGSACACCGNPTLEFYQDETLILSLSFHHSKSLRWPGGKWSGDGALTRQSADVLIKWLDNHGVTEPRQERERSLRLEEQTRISQEKWLKAMPSSLKPFWKRMQEDAEFADSHTQVMSQALNRQFPDPDKRILTLLTWYGSGEGPWSGFPSYEEAAEALLLLHTTPAILDAVQNVNLTEIQQEGLARFFGGSDFVYDRPQDLRRVPDGLKARLLEYCLKSDDSDKRDRAQRAFGNKK